MKRRFLRRLLACLLVTALVTGTGVPVAMVQAGHGHGATPADQAQVMPGCDPVQALGTGCKYCAPCVMLCCDEVIVAAAPALEPPLPELTVGFVDRTPGVRRSIEAKFPRGPPHPFQD
ncbi:MAG: hypothetical protein ACE5JZ_00065 [Kiloniellales bacterium]